MPEKLYLADRQAETGAGKDPLAIAATFRRRLQRRACTFGAWSSLGHPEIVSMFASAKGHFVGVDLEHSTTGLSTAQAMIRACHEYRRACLIRVCPGSIEQIRRLLDAGADGVILPQVSSGDDIDRAARLLRYPPAGERSFGVAAAHRYGRAFDAYVQSANESLTLIVQVETMAAIERIDAIVSHPAVDGVMIGPYDLSGSLGVPGVLTHPRVVEASKRVIEACAASSRSCGVHLVHPTLEDIRQHLAGGFTFLVLGSDVFNLWKRSVEVDAMIGSCEGSG